MKMENNKNKCPECGQNKKPWFSLCWECSEKENQKKTCDICDKEVNENHNLCKEHWLEMNSKKKKLNQIKYIQKRDEDDFKEKFKGKYYFNSQKVKSKSELLICYFLEANNIIFSYEPKLNLGNGVRPDFVLRDEKQNIIILEHFGMNHIEENKKKNYEKKELYEELCKKEKEFYFIYTTEEDLFDLKEKLGNKLNKTPLKKIMWK